MKRNPEYRVVAAVIVDNGEVLCVQKPQTKYLYTAFHWEYPGGKIEKGETEEQALVRELMEEMNYSIKVEEKLCETYYDYADFSVNLAFWLCSPVDQLEPRQFTLKEHIAHQWVKPEDLYQLEWCAADCIIPCLFLNRDLNYRDFHARLVPTMSKNSIIGVRTPMLRTIAKHLSKHRSDVVAHFLATPPTTYFEEKQLYVFLLNEIKDFEECMERLTLFLPTIDNWATCDQLSPKCFKHRNMESYVRQWLSSAFPYQVRFAMATAMRHCIKQHFDFGLMREIMQYRPAEHFDNQSHIYYLRMMQAWYFATMLVFHWDECIVCLQQNELELETHKMAMQKVRDSYRITDDKKQLLKNL